MCVRIPDANHLLREYSAFDAQLMDDDDEGDKPISGHRLHHVQLEVRSRRSSGVDLQKRKSLAARFYDAIDTEFVYFAQAKNIWLANVAPDLRSYSPTVANMKKVGLLQKVGDGYQKLPEKETT